MDCLSLHFWQTNSYCKFLCSWAPLFPGQCLCCLRAAFWNCYLSLFETYFFPICTFPKTHRNTQSQRSVPLCLEGVTQCVQQSPGRAVKDAHTGVGTRCDSMSCTSLGKQTTRSGTAWNKIHLSIAVVLQRNNNSKGEAIIQQLPQRRSHRGWLCYGPESPSQAPQLHSERDVHLCGTAPAQAATGEKVTTAITVHTANTAINCNEEWDLQVQPEDGFSGFLTQDTL